MHFIQAIKQISLKIRTYQNKRIQTRGLLQKALLFTSYMRCKRHTNLHDTNSFIVCDLQEAYLSIIKIHFYKLPIEKLILKLKLLYFILKETNMSCFKNSFF